MEYNDEERNAHRSLIAILAFIALLASGYGIYERQQYIQLTYSLNPAAAQLASTGFPPRNAAAVENANGLNSLAPSAGGSAPKAP